MFRRRLSGLYLPVLFLLCLCFVSGCAGHRIVEHSHPPSDIGSSALSIPLLAPLADVYTAGQPAAGDWPTLASRGIVTVVDLRTPQELPERDEATEVATAGLTYHRLPIAGADDLTLHNADALAALLQASSGPVLVHCASANRAGGLLALMAARQGMAPEKALELGRNAGMRSTEARVREVLKLQPAKSN